MTTMLGWTSWNTTTSESRSRRRRSPRPTGWLPPAGLLVWLCAAPAAGAQAPEGQGEGGEGAAGEPVTLAGGLQYVDLAVGEGPAVRRGDVVTVHYTGWLEDGTRFDSSRQRGKAFVFKVGQGAVIRGWELGVVGMQVDGKRRLTIPPKLGYGRRGVPDRIPPDATLVFEIELLAIR